MKFNKDDISALIGSILVHLVLLLILFYTILSTIVPSEDSGILVNFGDFTAATGIQEPQYSATRPQREIPPQTTPKPTPAVDKELLTQDDEETVKINEEKKKEKKEAEEQARREREEAKRLEREEAERKRKEEEQRQQEEAISNAVTKSFGMGNAQQGQQGETAAGEGNQGNPFGNTDTGVGKSAGYGSFDLGGRGIGSGGLPRPEYNGKEEGKIVLDITVDPDGNVVTAKIGRGTNIDHEAMRKSALEAAKRAKFNKIQGSNNQSGTITYNYKFT